MHASVPYSRSSSVHSDESSELSEHELEKNLGSCTSNTTFDIRSWRLQSALATKDNVHTPLLPPSPFKHTFPMSIDIPDTQSDDSETSDDSDNDLSLPPGLQAPSLSMSVTTIDSASASGVSSSMAHGPSEPSIVLGEKLPGHGSAFPRPIKGLPSSRRGTSPSFFQQTQPVQTQLSLGFDLVTPAQNSSSEVTVPPSQAVTSNERGLMVNLCTTPPMQTTLQSSPVATSPTPINLPTSIPTISPSPPSTSAGSPLRHSSPVPSRHSTSSPRPHIKPLPRRTGCAPRPRPPPRAGSTSAPVPATVATPSSWSSVILPPSSNPSLGSTTLGALLRPNPPAPAIPPEIEERLTAMAGRMGVGTTSGPNSTSRQSVSPNTSVLHRTGITQGAGALPSRGTSFSFGSTALSKTNVLSGAPPVFISGRPTADSANPSS
jgi:hypothetical protein